jgi:hypothetical protein
MSAKQRLWGAHAFSVLANAFCIRELFLSSICLVDLLSPKVRFGRMPKPARGTRALPRG